MIKLLFLSSLFIACLASCPSGTSNHNGMCYAYLGADFDRNTSLTLCQQTYGYYAQLVEPKDTYENNYVTTLVQSHATYHTWLEFTANGVYFVDGNGNTPKFTKFAVGEPYSVEVGYCLTIGLNGYWYSQPCRESHSALCQFPSNPKPTKPPVPTTTVPTPRYPSCVQKYLNVVPCKSGWEYYPPTCSCYRIITNTTYYNAMNTCRAYGARLASVHNSGQAAFIASLAKYSNSYWIATGTGRDNVIVGLTFDDEQQRFQWDDLSPVDYTAGFAPDEPMRIGQGQIILNSPSGYATYMRVFDCSYQTCRYAACVYYAY